MVQFYGSQTCMGSNTHAQPLHKARDEALCLKILLVPYMSLITRKPVFGVCNQVRLKPACSATETSQCLEILDIETRGIILSKQWITMVLIRLHECAGWSAALLFVYGINRFSHVVAHILYVRTGKDLVRQCVCAGSPDQSLFACVIFSHRMAHLLNIIRLIAGVLQMQAYYKSARQYIKSADFSLRKPEIFHIKGVFHKRVFI